MPTNTPRSALAALLALAGLAAVPARADETGVPGEFTLSGHVQAVTDFRFRGLSRSGGDFAVQGGIEAGHASGIYAGAWASSLSEGAAGLPDRGSAQLELYAGWRGEVASGITADAGLVRYAFPGAGAGAAGMWEPAVSLTAALGPATAEVGAAYAWKQDSLGGEDSLYLHADLGFGIPGMPVSLSAHLGHTDGALSPRALADRAAGIASPRRGGGLDWSLGASWAATPKLSLGARYVGVQGRSLGGYSDDALVGTLRLDL
jgi:uncharacterized protein (TIGR02001 family)